MLFNNLDKNHLAMSVQRQVTTGSHAGRLASKAGKLASNAAKLASNAAKL